MGTNLTRNGAPLRHLPDGAPRRMSDARNAWRKMTSRQRSEFLIWLADDQSALRDLECEPGTFSGHDFCEAIHTLVLRGRQ